MKITVLSGSPKGDLSVTFQYVRFIMKKNPDHEWVVHHVGRHIGRLAKDRDAFAAIMDDVSGSDAVLWATPVYVALVPSQLKRFVERVSAGKNRRPFAGKYAGVITTSIHFYDHTAHNYLRAVSEDLEMHFAGSFSPDMYDLMKSEEQQRLLQYAELFLNAAASRPPVPKAFAPLPRPGFDYEASQVSSDSRKTGLQGSTVVVIRDDNEPGTNLDAMVRRFTDSFAEPVPVYCLDEIHITGGCLGCCQCGIDYRCVYTGKDAFIDFYRDTVMAADVVVLAGTVVDRYLSWKWKQYFDRRFFNTHTPTLINKQLGYLVSGPLAAVPNLRQIMEASAEWEQANLVDIVTDECADSSLLDERISAFARNLMECAAARYVRPRTFLGVGGMKVFRDDVWGRLRFVFQADHAWYEANGVYDFPQYDEKTIEINNAMMQAMEDPDTRESIRKMIKTKMVEPHQHIVETR